MGTILGDLRYGARTLLRSPGFTAVAVVTLALGIGANTAIFSVVNAVLLRPLPWKDSERLVRVYESNPKRGWDTFSVSGPNFLDFRNRSEAFSVLAAWRSLSFNLSGPQGADRVAGGAVTASLLPLLGAAPALGRNFAPDEDRAGGEAHVAILGHALWRDRFGSDPAILGRAVNLNGVAYTVIGVLPADFQWVAPTGVLVPLEPILDTRRDNHVLAVFGRLRQGVTLERARAEMLGISGRLASEYPDTLAEWTVRLVSFSDWILQPEFRRALWTLASAVGLVLLIACANIANLLLARATGRHREVAIRAALGARWWRLARQMVAECLLLSMTGGALGLVLALWGVDLLRNMNPGSLPRLDEVSVDLRVLVFAMGVSMLTGLLCGMVPALHTSAARLNEALKEGGRPGSGAGRQRLRAALVVGQLAASLVLLIGAGLLIRSYWRLSSVDPGFDPRGLITAQLNLPGERYSTPARSAALISSLLERVRTLPGVERAAAASIAPFEAANTAIELEIEGRAQEPGATASANWRRVTPGYFATLGVTLIAGRDLTDGDVDGTAPTLIVSDSLARRFWPGQDPLGRRLRTSPKAPWWTVAGVVSDVRNTGLDQEIRPTIYLPAYQGNWTPMTLLVRSGAEPAAVVSAIRTELRRLDADLPLSDVRQMTEMMADSVAPARFNMVLIAVFAGVALLLAAVGTYGVMAYAVTQRAHELGIRMALGAGSADVLRLILFRGLKLALAGVAIGLAASWTLTRLLSSLLFDVSASDPATFAGVSLLLGGVALAASWIPARRATRVDPMVVLRYE